MPADKTIDTVLMIIAGGLLTLGLGSMLLGWLVRQWDRFMSRPATVSENNASTMGYRPDAVDQSGNSAERTPGIMSRSVIAFLEQCDDDALLDILSLVPGADEEYRFAESRVARFVGGRVEDRIRQVREVRHTEPPPPPGRLLRVRDDQGERLIPMET